LLADDQSHVRLALRALLERQSGVQVVGEAAHSAALLSQVRAACPDLVLLDWNLPGIAAGELLPALRELCPSLPVIALSGQPEVRRAALAAGADAFVSKADPPERLLAALRSVKRVQVKESTENPDRTCGTRDRFGG
jgi:DNA-binding NarL/FixJ family response regulator